MIGIRRDRREVVLLRAVHHATGVQVRELPVKIKNLLV
jgi:hypothetical protein